MTDKDTQIIKLRTSSTSDDPVVEVPYNIFIQMKTLNDMFSDLYDFDNYDESTIIDIPNDSITPEIMNYIIDYCGKYLQCENYTPDELMEWEIAFYSPIADKSFSSLQSLLPAVNYLNIEHMLRKGCKFVAKKIIKERSVEELRDYFGVENDFTPEEEARLKEDFAWCIDATQKEDNKESGKDEAED